LSNVSLNQPFINSTLLLTCGKSPFLLNAPLSNGGCGKEYDENNTIRYLRTAINLCFDCFIYKNEELAKKYNQYIPLGKCLIQL